jgi:hypothetical protein
MDKVNPKPKTNKKKKKAPTDVEKTNLNCILLKYFFKSLAM